MNPSKNISTISLPKRSTISLFSTQYILTSPQIQNTILTLQTTFLWIVPIPSIQNVILTLFVSIHIIPYSILFAQTLTRNKTAFSWYGSEKRPQYSHYFLNFFPVLFVCNDYQLPHLPSSPKYQWHCGFVSCIFFLSFWCLVPEVRFNLPRYLYVLRINSS